jgi:hypothetical protein
LTTIAFAGTAGVAVAVGCAGAVGAAVVAGGRVAVRSSLAVSGLPEIVSAGAGNEALTGAEVSAGGIALVGLQLAIARAIAVTAHKRMNIPPSRCPIHGEMDEVKIGLPDPVEQENHAAPRPAHVGIRWPFPQ